MSSVAMEDRRRVAFQSGFLLFLLIHFQFTFGQIRSSTERAALFSLRSSLGLRNRDWRRTQNPCLSWKGIRCQKDGLVVSIDLSGLKRTRLGRSDPKFSVESLTNFTLLASFNASGFLLPGPIPGSFAQLSALQVLDLRSCSVNGSIPLFLGNLSSLRYLDLSKNSLSGSIPASLGSLQNLQSLNLSDNNLGGSIPAEFGGVSSLVELDFSSNALSGQLPLELSGLRNLKKMVFGGNQLNGPLQEVLFSGLVRLEMVDFSRNSLFGVLPERLWFMPELVFLDASYNNFTGVVPNVSSNSNASSAVFNLSHNQLYGTLSPQLGKFGSIDLSENYFQGNVPDGVQRNSSLRRNCLRNLLNQRTLEDCTLFHTSRGLKFDSFGVPSMTLTPAPRSNKKSNSQLKYVFIGAFGGLGFIIFLVLAVLLCTCLRTMDVVPERSRSSGHVPVGGSVAPAGMFANVSSTEVYRYEQLVQFTDGFNNSNLIKHGQSGDLFRGVLQDGRTVVIKRIDIRRFENESYMEEFELLCGSLKTRLIPLLGHCFEHESEKFLVYKYMPNGDLSNALYRKVKQEDESLQSLDWITRLKIASGAAEGLSYLHDGDPPLVHRDVKATSILLDENFEVRLGSLSGVRVQGDAYQNVFTRLLRLPSTSQQGASGSASETWDYDVYCFGRLLLELITGKLGISMGDDTITKEWLEETLPCISMDNKNLVRKIIDPTLIIEEDLLNEVWAMAIVAKSCLNPKPLDRPPMRYVVRALRNPSKVVMDNNFLRSHSKVRRENSSSQISRTTSSRGSSWITAVLGSMRYASPENIILPQ